MRCLMAEKSDARDRHVKARRYGVVSVLSFFGVLFWLGWIEDYPAADVVLMAMLLAALPGLSMVQVPLLSGVPIDRMQAYWSSTVTLWVLGLSCWLVGTRSGDISAVGIVSLSPNAVLGWSTILTVAGLGIILGFRWLGGRFRVAETPLLKSLLPKTRRERSVFGVLSLAAGTCEELAYRGYVIPMLIPILGMGSAVVISSLVFGLMHGYQGWLGIFRTTLMGAVLAWGFIFSGSLVPAMIAHTAIDLIAGILIGDWLLSPEPEFGVDSEESLSV